MGIKQLNRETESIDLLVGSDDALYSFGLE